MLPLTLKHCLVGQGYTSAAVIIGTILRLLCRPSDFNCSVIEDQNEFLLHMSAEMYDVIHKSGRQFIVLIYCNVHHSEKIFVSVL